MQYFINLSVIDFGPTQPLICMRFQLHQHCISVLRNSSFYCELALNEICAQRRVFYVSATRPYIRIVRNIDRID